MKKTIIGILMMLAIHNVSLAQETKFFGITEGPLLHGTTTMLMAITIDQWNKRYGDIKEDYGILSIGIPLIALWFNEYEDFWWGDRRECYKDTFGGIIGAVSGKFLCYTF